MVSPVDTVNVVVVVVIIVATRNIQYFHEIVFIIEVDLLYWGNFSL